MPDKDKKLNVKNTHTFWGARVAMLQAQWSKYINNRLIFHKAPEYPCWLNRLFNKYLISQPIFWPTKKFLIFSKNDDFEPKIYRNFLKWVKNMNMLKKFIKSLGKASKVYYFLSDFFHEGYVSV